ncbi:PREDICTED: serine/threonine-protein kinase MARK2 [Myotis davidii]|uniref:serine/threonine-protein kinase MARK2 n=1 Tax=Myotis davidii TaxID=225400 RepID=UPI0003EC5543|nr:PREDICTED: serine/threonine-protein kinase MARK2 [Myotis davidii]
MEHVRGGDLREHLQTYGRMTEREARAAFRQLVSALHYCHHKGIAHRDLKPANILFDTNNFIKLADFGFAKEMKGQNLSTFCGTMYYLAPEIFKQDYDGCKADVWSLGVTLYKMVMGKVPFRGKNFVRQREKILAGKFKVPHFLGRQGQSFLNKLLTVDPNQRPTMEEVMEDPWLNMGQEEEPLRPYIEPPQEDLDPHVTEMMLDLGFKKDKIKQSVKQRTFNKVMGTYRILRVTQTKMPGRTIREKAIQRSPDDVQGKAIQRSPDAVQGKAIQRSADAVQEKAIQRSPDAVLEKVIRRSPDTVQEKENQKMTQRSPDAVQEKTTQQSPKLSKDKPVVL